MRGANCSGPLFYQRGWEERRRRGQTIIRETLTMMNVCSTENHHIQVWVPGCLRPARVGGGIHAADVGALGLQGSGGLREDWNVHIMS